MAAIKLVLSDVDGTLVTKGKVLTERAVAAVQALREAGVAFAITSGRPPRGMAMLVAPLNIVTPVAGFNGGMWVNPDLSAIEARTLPRDVADEAIAMMDKAGLDTWLYSGEDWLIRHADAPHAAREAWTVKFAPKVVAQYGDAVAQAVKIVGVSDNAEKITACETLAQNVFRNRASVALSQPYYLDVTHPEANKGNVTLYLGNLLGLTHEQIATIGDQPNDVLMFRQSGMSIAMGNSPQSVKAAADHVTEDAENEGFAIAMERLILDAARG